MRWWRRLRQEEDGNILYLTLIMMLLLTAFTLVLVNVLYIGVMKVKAQNAADQLALSGATLKARVLNQATNLNGLLYILRVFGTISETVPYGTIAETGVACGWSFAVLGGYLGIVETAHNHFHGDHYLDSIAKNNGLDLANDRYAVFPVNRIHMLAGSIYNIKWIGWLAPPKPPGKFPVVASIEPNHTWYVQSRVEIKTSAALVGGERLGIELPDIVTRARAEVVDYPLPVAGLLAGECLHNWRVQLASPHQDADDYIRRAMGSQNSGQAPLLASPQPLAGVYPMPQPGGSPQSYQDQAMDQYLAGLSPMERYKYYRYQVQSGNATASEKCEYYSQKQHWQKLTTWEWLEYQEARRKVRAEQNQTLR